MFGRDGQKLYDAIRLLPCVDAEAIIKPITAIMIQIEATVTPIFYWNDRLLGSGGLQRFLVFIEDLDDNMILHYEQLLLPKKKVVAGEPQKLVFKIPIHDRQIQHQYQLRVASDSYVVADTIVPISLHNCPLPTSLPPGDQHYCPRMALMDRPAFKAIKQFSPVKPTLLFVASRHQTRLTALSRFSTRVGVRNDDEGGLTYAEKYDLRHAYSSITQLQLARQYGLYVPDLINESGHDCAMNITVRTYAALGAPFRDEVRHTMDTNKAISVDAWNALASLRVLLRHKIAQHSTAELRQDLLPEFARDQDLEVAVALEKVLQHLAANSRRRFESNVDRLVICPACNQLTRQKGVMTAVYYYALNDVDYSEPHDQHVRRLNFNRWKHSFDSFALSPRLVEKLTCNNCDGRFDSSNGDKIRCKERLTDVRSASHVPRWIILYLCHDETNVKDLRATPHARQPFHGYWEQENRSGRYHFNTSSQRPYKLRAYALLAKPNYDHAVLRQAIELNGTPVQWLQLDDEDMVTIDHNDFYREGQKIEFLLYESVDQGDVIASGSESNLPRLRERKQ